MKFTFRIQYHTVWGEDLRVIFQNDETHVFPLSTRDGSNWQGSCDYLPSENERTIPYRYGVFRDDVCIRKELGVIPHTVYLGNAQQHRYIIDDCWRDLPAENYRYSSAFDEPHPTERPNRLSNNIGSCITFRALCPNLHAEGRVLGIIGSCNALGNWEYCRPIRMNEAAPNVWQLTLDAATLKSPFEYKFVAINEKTGAVEEWETRPNRLFQIQPIQRGETYLPAEAEVFFNRLPHRIAGTAIPVFSLRSEGSCGVGDFGDLKKFIAWAASTGQRAVQILPINDTTMTGTWMDSYPYNSISIYAFHLMYIDLRQLPELTDETDMKAFEKQRKMLNSMSSVNYEQVNQTKRKYLQAIFRQAGEQILAEPEYKAFFAKNEEWLIPYAAFSCLRDHYGTADFRQWGKDSVYHAGQARQMATSGSPFYPAMAFYYFLQYELHVQLSDACTYARSKGIIIKGDIPIGISRNSVEAWVEPYYFNMNGQAGAPPDAFSANGQNWGMPTYNWQIMEKDGYQWWKRRFQKMAEYFTAYRIDHILGFFRIWEIPYHAVHGLLGQFVPALPMSKDEIQSFGLNFDKEMMTRPYISDALLDSMFGTHAHEIRRTFLRRMQNGLYALRPEFNTQRKVQAYFAKTDEKASEEICEKLYSLISNVLFIADRDNPEMYHPRIGVQNDSVFRQLSMKEQEAFNRLYNHYYYERHNEFWYHEAMKKLPVLLQATPMLVCGEDLGMVPGCVPWVMNQLQILSLEIQRMPKKTGIEFGKLDEYPYLSVCTIGTHDMTTLRGWWKENPEQTGRFYYNELHHWGKVPEDAPGWLCEEILRHHLQCPSMLCILTWQDWTSMDETLRNPNIDAERINIPANPRHYWRWRMHITLEKLTGLSEFNQHIRQMIEESERMN